MGPGRAMVTGASEGIGRALALRLAQAGHQITVVARNAARLQELQASLPAVAAGEHTALVADLTATAGLEQVQAALRATPFAMLINNAGSGQFGDFAAVPMVQHQAVMRLNMDALVALAHTYLEQARSGDALMNVSSVLAFLPLPQSAVYAATKAFVTSFSEALWCEQRGRGVYVCNLCPGITTTEFGRRAGQANMSASAPRMMVQTAAQVAEWAWRALEARSQPTVLCGKLNLASVSVSRFLPRRTMVRLMGASRPS